MVTMPAKYFLAIFIDDPYEPDAFEVAIELTAVNTQHAIDQVATMYPKFANLRLREQSPHERLE